MAHFAGQILFFIGVLRPITRSWSVEAFCTSYFDCLIFYRKSQFTLKVEGNQVSQNAQACRPSRHMTS